ncbi:MAG: hypothetical protein LBF69_02020, partial [Prevotellaceae bacterium]|nr:hypothetical protein [Prevotellaceae bacterium]
MTTKFFRIRKNAFPSLWGRVREGLAFLFLLLWPFVLSAQNGVTVTNLAMDAGTVTFDVSWDKSAMPVEVWSDSVWVFVDYNNKGKMKRLPLLPGATLIQTSAPGFARVERVSYNDQGVWIIGNARSAGSFSATVQLLTETATATGACVYASNYPPVGTFLSEDKVTFTGTPNYDLTVKYDGRTFTLPADGTYNFPAGYTLVSF